MISTPILTFVYDRRKKASSHKEGSVELRITFERHQKFMTTGVRLLPKQWKNGQVINRLDAQEIQQTLETLMIKVRKVINEMLSCGNLNIDEIPARLKSNTVDERSFIKFCEDRVKVRAYGKKADTVERYDRFMRWLKNYGKIRFFSEVTDKNIILMDESLRATGMKNYSKWNNYHRFMNSFILDAIDEGYLKRNPYRWLHIEKEKNSGLQKYLTKEEFHKIETAIMPTKSLERVRDVFVFQTYTCLSYIDLANFDVEKMDNRDGVTTYNGRRGKTGKEFSFLLMKKAKAILDKYNGKLPVISNIKYNEYLKVVAQSAKVDKPITSHWARHTGATMLLNEGGVDMEVIARILGHSSTRQTRETYAKLLDCTVEKEMQAYEKRMAK